MNIWGPRHNKLGATSHLYGSQIVIRGPKINKYINKYMGGGGGGGVQLWKYILHVPSEPPQIID